MRICALLLASILFSKIIFGSEHDTLLRVDQKVKALLPQQTQSIGMLAQWIETNFNTETEKTRAIFTWVATHIAYDSKMTRTQIQNQSLSKSVQMAFNRRQAVCEGYAGLMDSLCELVGIPSYLVSGYTRINGQLDPTPHVWVATYVNENWKLSDPTWAAGAEVDGRFVKEFSPHYFFVAPAEMILSHMPYDPIWQLLYWPVSHRRFINSKPELKSNEQIFYFADSIQYHLSLNGFQQQQNELRRISSEQIKHSAIDQRTGYLQSIIKIETYNQAVEQLRNAMLTFNQGVKLYNNYVTIYNTEKPSSSKEKQMKQLLAEAQTKLNEAKSRVDAIRHMPSELKNKALAIIKSIDELDKKIKTTATSVH